MPKKKCKTVRKHGKVLKGVYRECVLNAKGLFDKRSFRWAKRRKVALLIGCPKGQWRAKAKRCKTGTKAYKMLTKR